jgi:methionine-rich copper-binding protein CopC
MRVRTMLAAALLATGLAAPAIAWHNHLTKSVPEADGQLAESPKEVRLWFSEKVDPKFSSVTLMKADSSKVDVSKVQPTDDAKSILVNLTAPLPSGKYLVRWRTAGDDGHAVRGTFSFSVK